MRSSVLSRILLCSLLILASQVGELKAQGKRIPLTRGGDGGLFLLSGNMSVQPGDTLAIPATTQPYTYIYLGGFTGTAAKPVVVINGGGQVVLEKGIDIQDCQFLKVSGRGTKDKYGFEIRNTPGTAVAVHGKSANIEVEGFIVNGAAFGCWVKNEASCDSSLNNWVLNNISVHDYEMHDIRIEGFYMGSTDANNRGRPVTCNGVQQFNKPSRLGNIKVYNGIINGTGRPAIMLSNASVGMSEIYNNRISNVGREFNDQQGTGISLGLYTKAFVHHNTIKNTYTWGIASLGGSGYIRIEDNIIDSSGYLDGRSLAWPWNILIDTRETVPVEKTRFTIRNNKLGKAGNKDNIYIGKTVNSYESGNIICNNTVTGKPARVDVEAGIAWSDCSMNAAPAQKGSSPLLIIGSSLTLLLLFYMPARLRRISSPARKSILS